MLFSNTITAIQTVNSSLTRSQFKYKLRALFKPPKANQILQKFLKTQSSTRAILFFRKLWRQNPSAGDSYSFLFVLKACTQGSLIVEGHPLHATVNKLGFERVIFLQTCLIDLYSKMGDMECAHRIFDEILVHCLQERVFMLTFFVNMGSKVISASVMLSLTWHALHGKSLEALDLFAQMNQTRMFTQQSQSCVRPNDVTFLGVLMACSHAGMVEEGKQYLKSMINDYGLCPRLPHLGCMVDLFCRAGLLDEAYDFVSGLLVESNTLMWRMLLGACCIHGNIELGAKVWHQLLELDPTYVGDDIALSNMYAGNGLWYEKMMVRDRKGCRKTPGCSSIQVASKVNEFVAGDTCHSLKDEINNVLGHLMGIVRNYRHISGPSDINNY